MKIMTAAWSTKIDPTTHQRIGISRGTPRGQPAGFRKYPALNPGRWFRSVSPAEYLVLYNQILAALNPRMVADDLAALAPNKVAVLVCFENATEIAAGKCWCHRSIVARWIEDRLGIEVLEVGHDNLDRWAFLRAAGMTPPTY